jgi:hypothetical protein
MHNNLYVIIYHYNNIGHQNYNNTKKLIKIMKIMKKCYNKNICKFLKK